MAEHSHVLATGGYLTPSTPRRITLALHRSSSAIAIGRLPSALYRPIAMARLPGERVVIRLNSESSS